MGFDSVSADGASLSSRLRPGRKILSYGSWVGGPPSPLFVNSVFSGRCGVCPQSIHCAWLAGKYLIPLGLRGGSWPRLCRRRGSCSVSISILPSGVVSLRQLLGFLLANGMNGLRGFVWIVGVDRVSWVAPAGVRAPLKPQVLRLLCAQPQDDILFCCEL